MATDQPDYEEIYRAERSHILRLCQLLLGDADDAREVSQEVFLKLHHALQSADTVAHWGAWLRRVAVNACRDRQRSRWWRWFRSSEMFIDGRHDGGAFTPEQHALDREARERIWRAFSALPARQREVFAFRYLEGWSTSEVAAALQLSSGTVKRHLFRAVHEMRRALGERR